MGCAPAHAVLILRQNTTWVAFSPIVLTVFTARSYHVSSIFFFSHLNVSEGPDIPVITSFLVAAMVRMLVMLVILVDVVVW